uniref:Peptidase S1 domain-containing protein n=1 Tax=Anopheles minimus TaxID=112268 RepID=A0A182W979_9DIPT
MASGALPKTEKLPLFNLNTCGMSTTSFLVDESRSTLPWLGNVVLYPTTFSKCIITLVSEWYAIGPASCLENAGSELRARFGDYQHSEDSICYDRNGTRVCTTPSQTLQIHRIIIHPRYNNKQFADNIALIELLTPADTTQPNVKPICVPIVKELYTNRTTNLSVVSYSKSNLSFDSKPINYVNASYCTTVYSEKGLKISLEDKRICGVLSAEDEMDCVALKAGVALQELVTFGTSERYVLRGLDGSGLTCELDLPPAVYINLYAYLDWMLYNMRPNELDEAAADATTESKWKRLQQREGNEKLRLFEMDSCGESLTVQGNARSITYMPWVGSLEGYEDVFNTGARLQSKVVLISEWYALAPAHIFNKTVSWRSVTFGYHDVGIKQVTIHPDYNGTLNQNNIALIELLEPANTTKPFISPICMPLMEEFRNSTPLQVGLSTSLLDTRRVVRLSTLNCQARLIHRRYLLTNPEVPLCADDYESGVKRFVDHEGSTLQALLFFADQKRFFLSGISFLLRQLRSENEELPYFFTDTSLYLDWILDNMNTNMERNSSLKVRISQSSRIDRLPVRNVSRRRLFNFNTCGLYSNNYAEPWIGYVEAWHTDSMSYQSTKCTVTLISNWYAVGPARCLNHEVERSFVQFGGFEKLTQMSCNGGTCRISTQTVAIGKIILHPEYNTNNHDHNIALVQLATPADIAQDNVKPICLPVIDEIRSYDVSSIRVASKTALLDQSLITPEVGDKYIDPAECQKRWDGLALNIPIQHTKLCILRIEDLDCYSIGQGFPLHTTQELFGAQRRFLRGIMTDRPGSCDIYYPIVFTDVDVYLDWILENMNMTLNTLPSSSNLTEYLTFVHAETLAAIGEPSPQPWFGLAVTNVPQIQCVVTLISEWYAVGAASCFKDGGKDLRILLGGQQELHERQCLEREGVEMCTYPTQLRNIQRVIIHPRFTINAINNDIALIELRDPADTTQPNVNPICLPVTPALYTNLTTNWSVISYSTDGGNYRDQIVNHVDLALCTRAFVRSGLPVEEKSICVIVPEDDVPKCTSLGRGVPLQERKTFGSDVRYILRGLDILGLTCSGVGNILNTYLDLYAYLDWILYNMKHHVVRNAEAVSANASLVEWNKLQQEPGNEKLKLFNMDTCGANVNAGDSIVIPWIGTLKAIQNASNLLPTPGQSIVKPEETPSMVVLISDRYALAPAHVFSEAASWRSIILGYTRSNILLEIECSFGVCDPPYQEVQIKNIIIHPGYNSTSNMHNLALIELLEPANTTKQFISPICMPLTESIRNSTPFEMVVPKYIYHEESSKLLPLDQLNCQERFAQWSVTRNFVTLTNHSRCAVLEKGYGEAATVKSGAPLQTLLQIGEKQRYFLGGINSFKDLVNYHNPNYPYLFTDINPYLEWILANMQLSDGESDPSTIPPTALLRVNPVPIRKTSKGRLFNFNTCGVYTKGSSLNATYEAEPWAGFVYSWKPMFNVSSFDRCAVVLISDWYTLGMASCFDQEKNRSIQFGGYNTASEDSCYDFDGETICRPTTHMVPVEKIIVHPQYDRASYANNIALVQLGTPADISQKHVKPICLPIIEEIRSYDVSSMATVTFGSSTGSFVTEKVDRRYIDTTECQRRWDGLALNFQIKHTKQCSLLLHDRQESCSNILAFPGFALHTTQTLLGTERNFVRGLLVLEPKLCSSYYPAIYTDVDVYLDWILENMEEKLNTQAYNLTERLIFV